MKSGVGRGERGRRGWGGEEEKQEKMQGELDRHHDKQLSRSWRTNEHFITKVRHVDGGNSSRRWEGGRGVGKGGLLEKFLSAFYCISFCCSYSRIAQAEAVCPI